MATAKIAPPLKREYYNRAEKHHVAGRHGMPRLVNGFLFLIMLVSFLTVVHAQEAHPTELNRTGELKTVVVAAEATSGAEIAVPPLTSVRIDLSGEKKMADAEAIDLPSWLSKVAALNGLQSPDLLPWHIALTYDQFDRDGDNIHSGVYEEYWTSTNRYKRIYKSDNFTQSDYATDRGLYRQGDQQWPNAVQSEVRAEVVAPFAYAASLEGVHGKNVERTFSGYKLRCVLLERDQKISDPTQYCFEPGGSVLRYDLGQSWYQTVYNRIVSFQGRNLAREVDLTDGGKPLLKLRVQTIELISHLDDADFIPPPDAIGPFGDRVRDVGLHPIDKPILFEWPASLRTQHFTVQVEMLVGKDGHVISAHGISDPPEGYKACENVVKKMVFKPFLVLDKPVEVEQKFECGNN